MENFRKYVEQNCNKGNDDRATIAARRRIDRPRELTTIFSVSSGWPGAVGVTLATI
jgi:hypothetical protein